MKKILAGLISALFICSLTTNVNAQTPQIQTYLNKVEEINQKYDINFHILEEETYNSLSHIDIYQKTYDEYIQNILDTDIDEFERQIVEQLTYDEVTEVKLNPQTRSTSGQKTVYFYTNRNAMTLNYRYSGSSFDTSYKPTASVRPLSNTAYFIMRTYTGSFSNSNRSYTVYAKGDILTTMGVGYNKSFDVKFTI